MSFNFNQKINRHGTDCIKWDALGSLYHNEDAIPFWIADADYPTMPEIVDALVKRSQHGIFGYTSPSKTYYAILNSWFKRHYNYEVNQDWVVITPGVVFGICLAINALTMPNDKIIIQKPVYNPFAGVIKANNRVVSNNELIQKDGDYFIDFHDLEKKMQDGAKMMIFCSPHNPISRVWTKDEVEHVVTLCHKYKVILVSDEIHCDLIIHNHTFTSVGVFKEIQDQVIICTAISKTFNTAGLNHSNIIIPSKEYRNKVHELMECYHYANPTCFGVVACEAAYTYGDQWLKEQCEFLKKNADQIVDFCRYNGFPIPNIQATYLTFLDLSSLKLSSKELEFGLCKKGIAVASGVKYGGKKYDGYIRLNFACPQEQLVKGLSIMQQFVDEVRHG